MWGTYCDLLWYVRAGCNKPRFELLAPAYLNAGGNLDALEKFSQHDVSIRAMGGHSNLSVNPAEMGRVKITHEMFPQLYHVTYWTNINSIYDIGLRPGGLVGTADKKFSSAVNRRPGGVTKPTKYTTPHVTTHSRPQQSYLHA